MKKIVCVVFACIAACGTNASNPTSSDAGSDAGPTDGGDGGQYNTLSGTVTAPGGVSATFTGAMEMDDETTSGATAYFATPAFASVGTLTNVVFNGPTGSSFFSLSLTLGQTAGAPAATTLSCSSAGRSANLDFAWKTSDGVAHAVGASPGVTGSSCSVTFDTPMFVTANSEGEWYFASGSLSGTLVSEPLSDGGVETGTISAHW